jgi:hypothetical protein
MLALRKLTPATRKLPFVIATSAMTNRRTLRVAAAVAGTFIISSVSRQGTKTLTYPLLMIIVVVFYFIFVSLTDTFSDFEMSE